jgi:AcrR family transcriptional regulator
MGALYSYFSSKDDLLEMLQNQRRAITKRILEESIVPEKKPATMLQAAILAHIYLSEAMQPWFYFSFMEAKNLSKKEQELAVASELYTEKILTDILRQGQREGKFILRDPRLTASVIKAMLQDWYLKRSKYAKRGIRVDQYAQFVLQFVEAFVMDAGISVHQQNWGYEEGPSKGMGPRSAGDR